MALSKPLVPDSIEEIPVIAQHYLECGNADCERNAQFYCNPCHQPMCEQCRDEHQKNKKTKNHEVVLYRQRKRQLPEGKCSDHPNKDVDVLCEDCQVPLCSKCALKDHRKHSLIDLENFYSERSILCNDEIYKINQYFLPTSQDMQRDVLKNIKSIKATMDKIRKSIKAEAETFKSLVDTVMSENIEQANRMEELLMEELQRQDNTYKDYISYLEDRDKEFYGFLAFPKLHNNPIIFSPHDNLKVRPIPEITKPVSPVFTAGQYSKDDVAKLLGRAIVPDAKPENRKIKLIKTDSTELKPTEKMKKQEREKHDAKQTLSLSSFVTKVREYTVSVVGGVRHISVGKSGRLWVIDDRGKLVQTNLHGLHQQKILASCVCSHTVTQDGDLIYTDEDNKAINRITKDNTITEFIKTGKWTPTSIHSSHINGDILVWMSHVKETKITRYNKTGKEIQNIQRKGFIDLYNIAENINGDICILDWMEGAVVVLNKSGQQRFSYTKRKSIFSPHAICTDIRGHILVCDRHNKTVIVLSQDGQFLCQLLTKQHGIEYASSLFVDDDNNLHVGQSNTNKVKVYKYLQ
ncbi:uncharacterized protein LOC128167682 [Crassostrea angulata]|uniref:uncharacterized protein LOC128167682 n=1 Tax=Magallana angulata TaxID=2784310 RepID=UPI0022B092A8|nr:uncharacterized protein LOC128167682 [Crassostrea angulata]